MTKHIKIDRRCGIHIYKTDKKSIYELKKKKIDRRSVRIKKRVDRRQVEIVSKDQIQHPLQNPSSNPNNLPIQV